MNINLKLKERREKINEILKRKRTKVMRKFKSVKKEAEDSSNDQNSLKNKYEKYLEVEKMINNYDSKIGYTPSNKISQRRSENTNAYNNISKQSEENIKVHENKTQNNNRQHFDKKKVYKTNEEIEKEKQEKTLRRKKTYRKLNRKTSKGQPIMKYQVEHMFQKIKDKINKGII